MCGGHGRWRRSHRLQLCSLRHIHTPRGGLGGQDRGAAQRGGESQEMMKKRVMVIHVDMENTVVACVLMTLLGAIRKGRGYG